MDRSAAQKGIIDLVTRFETHFESYKDPNYKEARLRSEFINPFFENLGWDVYNVNNYAEAYREVIQEDTLKIEETLKAPDYSFRLSGGKRLFFVEAKKPSISVRESIQPAYQVRRYGWSAKHPISVVTDFEEFAIYDCTTKPNPNDKPSVARIKYLTFQDYLREFDFIWDTFSREQVLRGSFDKFVQSDRQKQGTATVDKDFLASLDRWRTYLAVNISWNNKLLGEDEINFAVQQLIDRIIFLRIAEDRKIEPYGSLKNALSYDDYYSNLFLQFKRADEKYNSGLFDFKRDRISETLKIENKVLKIIIDELYYPKCPYEFSVLPIEILGSVYEQFLGKVIRITPAHHAKVEEKPEVRKAGGVYYTPQYIVDYIVKNTVGKLVEGKTPDELSSIKIVDPACGSGSFLIGALHYLFEYHRSYYSGKGIQSKGRKDNPMTPDGNLATSEKKRILLNNIYGVDLDANAVEVTKLSLLLKCLEGETDASINQQLRLFNERVLPTLDNNIKNGNSLIDTDYYDNHLDFGEERTIKPFNWGKAFPNVFNKGGFDCVIGNPPYGAVYNEDQKRYFISNYTTVEGRYDNFELFIEKGLNLLNKDGVLSFIIPSPFLTNLYSRKLRQYIVTNCSLKEIASFSIPVFDDPTVHTCIISIEIRSQINSMITIKNQIDSIEKLNSKASFQISQEQVKNNKNFVIDIFINPIAKTIVEKLQFNSLPLGEVCFIRQCIKTGDDTKYIIKAHSDLKEPWKKSLRGKSISRYGIKERDIYLKYGDWLARNWKNISFYETNKIAIRETGTRITATLDIEKRYFLSSLYSVYYKQRELNCENELKFLLGILNSDLANYYIKLIALNLTEGAFTKMRTNQLARLPIVKIETSAQTLLKDKIANLVDKLLIINEEKANARQPIEINQLDNKIEYCESKINEIVYHLYGLTEDEIIIVESAIQ